MPSKSRPGASGTETALIWSALFGAYLAAGGAHQSEAGGVLFAGLVLVVTTRNAPALALLPLLLIPAGVYPLGLGLLGAVLLAAGPFLGRLVIASVEVVVDLLRTSDSGLERIAAFQLLSGPAWACALTITAVFTVIEAGVLEVLVLVGPALLIWRKRLATAALTGLAGAAIAGWPTAPLVFVALIVAVITWRLSSRPPKLWHPLPAVGWRAGPLTWLRLRRCDRRIEQGDLFGARSITEAARSRTRHHVLRLTLLDIEERSYQGALSLEWDPRGVDEEMDGFAALLYARALSGIAQFESADRIYASLLGTQPGKEMFDPYVRLLRAENALAAGNLDSARQLAEETYRAVDGGKDGYFLRLRAACVLAECAIADDEDPVDFEKRIDVADEVVLSDRWTRRMGLRPDPLQMVRQMFGRKGNLILQQARVETLRRRYEPDDSGWDPEAFALAMAISKWSDDLVELHLTEAAIADKAERQDERVRFGVRALMELDATRYRLSAQSARTSWSRRFQRALAVTLDAAFQQENHDLVAELLEFARVQALPAATAEASEDLVLSTPPVVRLRGLARLARPADADRPAPVSLEAAMQRAAGAQGWWLSFWEADEWLYWALIPPEEAEVNSGRISLRPGSTLRSALTSLEESLPLLGPNEDPASADFRIARSPLLIDPAAELELSLALGTQLIPPSLLAAARRLDRDGGKLSLAIAPSPSLGYVPWGILASQREDGSGSDRLLDLCDWVIAPSAALLVQAPEGERPSSAPLALAVADTANTHELGPLEGARQQAAALPPEVAVLGGRHWTDRIATLAGVEEELARLGPEVTVAFLCHALRGTPEEPSRGGVVISTAEPLGEQPQLLSPVGIFEMTARGVAMPSQVLLQACDTSALFDASSGEWLTLAPALIAGGTREVLATLYPMPDLYIPGDPVIDAAVRGTSLREAVVLAQRVGLARWEAGKATEPAHTPLSWAAYAPICVAPMEPGPEVKEVEAEVSARFVRVLSRAIKEARERGRTRLDSGFILSAVFDDSNIAEMYDGGSSSLKPSAFVWTLGPFICSSFLRFRDGATRELVVADDLRLEVSETLIAAFADACRSAERDGILLEPEYLLQEVIRRPSAARRILRLLSTLSRRPFEVTARALDHNLAETIAHGQKFLQLPDRWDSEEEQLARAFLAWTPGELHEASEPPAPIRPPATAQE
jgi:hypothetical protein